MKKVKLINSEKAITVDDVDYDKVSALNWRLTGRNNAASYAYYGESRGRVPIRLSCSVPEIIFDVDKDANDTVIFPEGKQKLLRFGYKNGDRLDNRRHNLVMKMFEPGTNCKSDIYRTEKVFHVALKSKFKEFFIDYVYEYEIEGSFVDFLCKNALVECKIKTSRENVQRLVGQLTYYRLHSTLPIVVLLPDDVSIRSDLRCMLPPNTSCLHERDIPTRLIDFQSS